jgi:hypothetical protein
MRLVYLAIFLGMATLCLPLIVSQEEPYQVRHHEIDLEGGERLSLALLGDFHFTEDPMSFDYLDLVIRQVTEKEPDLIFLSGDFIYTKKSNSDSLISKITNELSEFNDIAPTFAVLGNHDNWSNRETWIEELQRSPIKLIENTAFSYSDNICLRGLGDYTSGHYKNIRWPGECDRSIKITLTHDPYGGFVSNSEGIVLAGHTHCGQIRLPLVGAPWTPTKAPPEARCGLFSDEDKIVVVTGGLGTSVLSLRLGTIPHWNLLELNR